MKKIMLAEDSGVQAKFILNAIQKKVSVEIVVCPSFDHVEKAIKEHGDEFFLALVSLVLPGSADGQVLDLTLGVEIPTVVITSSFSPTLRKEIFARNVIDYVVKDSTSSIDYLANLVRRIHNNRDIKTLVVDDSKVARKIVSKMLTDFQLQVFEAGNGVEALEVLAENQDIKLMVTDFDMPKMDGFELIKEARKFMDRDNLSIIGLSASDDVTLSAKLIKAGANDFILKPFQQEEFYCRVSQNLDVIEHITALSNAATRDYLTGLYNRRHFFEVMNGIIAGRDRGNHSFAVGMLDIDHFKGVNDTYGHDAGDEALKLVAEALSSILRDTDILARMGGEEFCLVAVDPEPVNVKEIYERFRVAISDIHFEFDGTVIPLRMSIGVSINPKMDIQAMLIESDEMLYAAKEGGRNQVIVGK